MLRVLRVENWKSYYAPVEFTMLATREQKDGQTLARIKRTRVLPTTAIYGANAAGKSALVDALRALQQMVTEPRGRGELLPVIPNLALGKNEPTTIGVEFTVLNPDDTSDETTYFYEASATKRQVVSEHLLRVTDRGDVTIFHRQRQEFCLEGHLNNDPLASALARTVPSNRLYLEVARNSDTAPANLGIPARWFDLLYFVDKGATMLPLQNMAGFFDSFQDLLAQGLSAADTGITGVRFIPVDRSRIPVTTDQMSFAELEAQIDDRQVFVITAATGDMYRGRRCNDGTIHYEQLVAHHGSTTLDDAEGFDLAISQESDGTSRYMNLLPLFTLLGRLVQEGVFIIDELDDSLHPVLTAHIIKQFLNTCGTDQRRQLIFTTHDVQLMRSDLLRRDEIWFAEKFNHQSELIRLTDFADAGPRKGTDLQSMYMSGRLGGVPVI